jgi:hypothetical protein
LTTPEASVAWAVTVWSTAPHEVPAAFMVITGSVVSRRTGIVKLGPRTEFPAKSSATIRISIASALGTRME